MLNNNIPPPPPGPPPAPTLPPPVLRLPTAAGQPLDSKASTAQGRKWCSGCCNGLSAIINKIKSFFSKIFGCFRLGKGTGSELVQLRAENARLKERIRVLEGRPSEVIQSQPAGSSTASDQSDTPSDSRPAPAGMLAGLGNVRLRNRSESIINNAPPQETGTPAADAQSDTSPVDAHTNALTRAVSAGRGGLRPASSRSDISQAPASNSTSSIPKTAAEARALREEAKRLREEEAETKRREAARKREEEAAAEAAKRAGSDAPLGAPDPALARMELARKAGAPPSRTPPTRPEGAPIRGPRPPAASQPSGTNQ